MSHPGYLHHWIQKHFRSVWPTRKVAPRLLGTKAVLTAQQENFLEFGKALVSRFGDTFPDKQKLPIEFGILDLEHDGAWVIWPAKCYGVLITKALLRKIQRISFEATELLPMGFDAPVKKSNYLVELWGDLPRDQAHFYHFGSLIGHIAFSFIIHHELAHAGLGHEALRYLRISGVSEFDDDFMNEHAGVLATGSHSDNQLRSQALETDADVHGMLYTRQLLRDEADTFRDRVNTGDIMGVVWSSLLRERNCEELMLFIGIAVGLLALLPDLEAERINATIPRTHPPLPSRLLLVFHVAGSISRYPSTFRENRSAAITTTIALIAAFEKEEYGKRISSQPVSQIPDSRDETGGSDGKAEAKWRTLSHLSIVDAWLHQDELNPYWETLVSQLRILSPMLAPYARSPESLRYSWYRQASETALASLINESSR